MNRLWAALVIKAAALDDPPEADEILPALLDDYSPAAIEDLAERPLPPGGLWDPTYPPIPDPPPTPLHWRVFFQNEDDRASAIDALRAAFPTLGLEPIDVPDDDWAARSQKSLTSVTAGSFIVAPPWDLPDSPPEGVTVIVIEPSMGFGTGHHATTRMCLRLLSDVDVSDLDVLDLGTGSGVLSMAAALRGARSVVGVDVDADAIASAEASARLNTLPDTIEFRVADFRSSPPAAADVVLANLTGGILTSSAPAIKSLVRTGGQMILSGFDHSEVDAVVAAFDGFTEGDRVTEDTWMALNLRVMDSGGPERPAGPAAESPHAGRPDMLGTWPWCTREARMIDRPARHPPGRAQPRCTSDCAPCDRDPEPRVDEVDRTAQEFLSQRTRTSECTTERVPLRRLPATSRRLATCRTPPAGRYPMKTGPWRPSPLGLCPPNVLGLSRGGSVISRPRCSAPSPPGVSPRAAQPSDPTTRKRTPQPARVGNPSTCQAAAIVAHSAPSPNSGRRRRRPSESPQQSRSRTRIVEYSSYVEPT